MHWQTVRLQKTCSCLSSMTVWVGDCTDVRKLSQKVEHRMSMNVCLC